MIITILEARVDITNWKTLQDDYSKAIKNKEKEPLQSYLLQDQREPENWTILSMWSDMKVLEEMRSKGTPVGVLIFRKAGAEPKLNIYKTNDLNL